MNTYLGLSLYSFNYLTKLFKRIKSINFIFDSDLESLKKYKRRNPFDEYGYNELMNVYLRSEVEKKAISVWGSLENLKKEKEKRRIEYERQKQAVFNLKKTLRDYHNRIEQLENPLTDKQYVSLNESKNYMKHKKICF